MIRPSSHTLAALSLPLLFACTGDGEGGGVNLFTVEDDIALGQDLRDQINNDPENFPVLDEAEYPEAYAYLYDMRDVVLASGEVRYEDEFDWEIYIIHDDATLNAFAAPGGYMWVYTGLIRYLEVEDHLEGVLGHEMAHADRRHSTEQLSKAYGLSVLIGLVLGEDPGLLAEVAAGLVNLSFSRSDESEADEYSVRYLCDSIYAADGAAGFFEKLLEEGGGDIPEFLSTHPSSETRVEEIEALAIDLDCNLAYYEDAEYQAFLDMLPPVEEDGGDDTGM